MNWKFKLGESVDMRTKVKSYYPIAWFQDDDLDGRVDGVKYQTKAEAQALLDTIKEQLKGE